MDVVGVWDQQMQTITYSMDKVHIHAVYNSNKVLLYSIGNYIQYPVINPNGKEYEKECIPMNN